MNKNKNGAKHKTDSQLMKESQFFLFLNTFKRKKKWFTIWPGLGFVRLPDSSLHPYAGGSSTFFKKIINK